MCWGGAKSITAEFLLYIQLLLKHKIVSEYDQEILQSQTADTPMVPQGRATQQSQDTRKTNKAKQQSLFSLHGVILTLTIEHHNQSK